MDNVEFATSGKKRTRGVLTGADVKDMTRLAAEGITCAEIARRFGVSVSAVSQRLRENRRGSTSAAAREESAVAEKSRALTFDEICLVQPVVREIEYAAQRHLEALPRNEISLAKVYALADSLLTHIVGVQAQWKLLRTQECYDTVWAHLTDTLEGMAKLDDKRTALIRELDLAASDRQLKAKPEKHAPAVAVKAAVKKKPSTSVPIPTLTEEAKVDVLDRDVELDNTAPASDNTASDRVIDADAKDVGEELL